MRAATAGLNAQRFPVTTLMLNDESDHGVPVAHIIHSSGTANLLTEVINALSKHVGAHLVPKFVLVDDADTEIAAVQASNWGIKGCKVALCIWHVKRAWLKNVITKLPTAKNYGKRAALYDALSNLQRVKARVRGILRCAHARA